MTDASERLTFAEDVERVLRDRAEFLAQSTSDEDSRDDLEALLLFAIAEETYAVPVGGVREILQDYELSDIPCLPKHILGVINIRGDIVSATDIGLLMGLRENPVESEASVIVVAKGEAETALMVDSIGDIVEVPESSIEPPLATAGKVLVQYVAGSVYVEGRLVGVVNLEPVLKPIGEKDS